MIVRTVFGGVDSSKKYWPQRKWGGENIHSSGNIQDLDSQPFLNNKELNGKTIQNNLLFLL